MSNIPDPEALQNLVESQPNGLTLEQIDTVKLSLLELRATHGQEFTRQIFNILIFQIYSFLKQLESQLINAEEVTELLLILQNPDDLKLQFEYFNWLFVKIINHKQKVILPSNNQEFKRFNY